MVFTQNRRNCHRIFSHPCKFLHDQPAGILLIGFCNLLRGQTAHARNFPIHVIRMRRSITWNPASRLGPAGGIGGMGMYDSADLRKRPVQLQMRRRIRGRTVASFYFIAVQIHHNHILRRQLIIFHTAWLNDKQPAFSVNSADVAPGKGHQTIPGQIHVRFIYCFFEFFQHRFLPFSAAILRHLQFNLQHCVCIFSERLYRSFFRRKACLILLRIRLKACDVR